MSKRAVRRSGFERRRFDQGRGFDGRKCDRGKGHRRLRTETPSSMMPTSAMYLSQPPRVWTDWDGERRSFVTPAVGGFGSGRGREGVVRTVGVGEQIGDGDLDGERRSLVWSAEPPAARTVDDKYLVSGVLGSENSIVQHYDADDFPESSAGGGEERERNRFGDVESERVVESEMEDQARVKRQKSIVDMNRDVDEMMEDMAVMMRSKKLPELPGEVGVAN